MINYFKDKVVWITGASSGIGEALVKELNKHQAKLVISARRVEELERVKAGCVPNDNILIVPVDMEQQHKMNEQVDVVIKQFGRIDLLINNAGISQRALAVDTQLDIDKKIMEVNYFGAVALTKAILPHMIKQQSGHIGVISSVTGKIGVPMRSAYAASKHALFGFFDALRAENAKFNIFVTIICPGYIRTNISLNALLGDGKPQRSMDKTTDAGMTPEELAAKIVKALARRKNEVYFGGKEVLGIYLRRFVPNLFFSIIKKARPV